MQLDRQKIKEQAAIAATGFLWVTGLLLAGSDNPLMPWPNLAGIVIFLTATFFMARIGLFEKKAVENLSSRNYSVCKNILFPRHSENGIQPLNSAIPAQLNLRRENKWKHPREILPSTL
ncbi:MAG: hypothetical protein RBR67_01050 [Desulfobacterium sp.]|nr:hypothetical protein [Desulfobacterium sp.]